MTRHDETVRGGALGAGGRADQGRLRSITASTDDATRAVLDRLALPARAHVLDVGCGNGSVASYIAHEHPERTVWALDRDVSLVEPDGPTSLRIVAADVRVWEPPTRFHLVHARFVLSHLPDRDAILSRLVGWLAPGGLLVVTEPYHLPYGEPETAVAEVLARYRELAEAGGMSFAFSRRVAGLMLAAGADDVTVTSRPGRLGGGPGTDRWAPLVERVADDLGVSEESMAAFRRYAADPTTHDIPQILLTTVGQWPS